MLVLSKVYLVTKGSLVPLVVAASERPGGDELASANARLGLLSSLASLVAAIPAIGVLELLGGAWVLRLDMVVFVVGTVVALRLPVGRTGRVALGTPTAAAPAPAAESAAAARPRRPGTRRRPSGPSGRVSTPIPR